MRIPYLPPKSVLVRQAVRVVDAFDQANIGKNIAGLGPKGKILNEEIAVLRRILNEDQKRTTFTQEEVN